MDYYTEREAGHVAQLLDRGCVGEASQRLREDMAHMYDPCQQRELLHAINQMDRKGLGADLVIQHDPYSGRESWSIQQYRPPVAQYPCYENQQQYGGYRPQPYGYEQRPCGMPPQYRIERRDPGEAIAEGLAIGAGVAIGSAIIRGIGGGGHHNYYDHRGRR